MDPAEFYAVIGVDGQAEIANDELRSLSLRLATSPGSPLRQHLSAMLFGSSGVRYRRLDVGEQLARLPCPVFLELHCADRLIGSYVFSALPIRAAGQEALGIYRCMLTIHPDFAGQGLGRWMAGEALGWLKSATSGIGKPVLTWGCVDRRNERSLQLLESLGAESLGNLCSTLVYRQWPRRRIAVEGADWAGPGTAMRDSMDECGVITQGFVAGERLRVQGDEPMLAEATITETGLAMEQMGGRWDVLYRRLLKHAGPARRRFDPANFRYLRMNDLVVTPENIGQWPAFISTLLARRELHMAMFVLDPQSMHYRLLDEAGVFGQFGRATRQDLEVMGQAWHCESDFLRLVGSAPLGIGPLDI